MRFAAFWVKNRSYTISPNLKGKFRICQKWTEFLWRTPYEISVGYVTFNRHLGVWDDWVEGSPLCMQHEPVCCAVVLLGSRGAVLERGNSLACYIKEEKDLFLWVLWVLIAKWCLSTFPCLSFAMSREMNYVPDLFLPCEGIETIRKNHVGISPI